MMHERTCTRNWEVTLTIDHVHWSINCREDVHRSTQSINREWERKIGQSTDFHQFDLFVVNDKKNQFENKSVPIFVREIFEAMRTLLSTWIFTKTKDNDNEGRAYLKSKHLQPLHFWMIVTKRRRRRGWNWNVQNLQQFDQLNSSQLEKNVSQKERIN